MNRNSKIDYAEDLECKHSIYFHLSKLNLNSGLYLTIYMTTLTYKVNILV